MPKRDTATYPEGKIESSTNPDTCLSKVEEKCHIFIKIVIASDLWFL